MSAFGVLYLIATLLVALYGANSLLLSILYLRHAARSRRRSGSVQTPWPGLETDAGGVGGTGPSGPEPLPLVTVQLPLFNEFYVVKRLIDAVAGLDYPRHRLQVQVLDDSTDESARLAQARVAHHRARGLDIEWIHRSSRQGFKAGALAHGLESARGEYIAVFDADFVPPRDFLKRAVPPLVADPGLGFVQARWGYLNADYSPLTHAQSIALDGHFVVEHLGRNRSGLLMNFNGTAGVWRRRAIESAGGWQSDTLTEDVDLSFRAQLAGWRALYLPDVEAPAELPPHIAAFQRQQARWAAGAAQCLVKLGGSLWRGRMQAAPGAPAPDRRGRLPWAARLEGLVHLAVWVAHPMSLVLLLLTLPMLLGRIPLTFNLSLFWLVALGPTFAYALSQRHLYPDWKRRMLYMPVLALLGTGIALSNTLAIAQGLLGVQLPFARTPKYRIERRSDRWAGRRYAVPFQWVMVGELALAGYALATIVVAVSVGNALSVPFLLLHVGGYGTVGLQGLADAWQARRSRPRLRRATAVADTQAK